MADASKINPVRIENYKKPNGVASLDSNGKIPAEQIPALPYLPTSGGTVDGTVYANRADIGVLRVGKSGNTVSYMSSFGELLVGNANNPSIPLEIKRYDGKVYSQGVLWSSDKAVAGGVASLDDTGKVPEEQIPSLPYLSTSGGELTGDISLRKYKGVIKTILPPTDYGFTRIQIVSQDSNYAELDVINTAGTCSFYVDNAGNGVVFSNKKINLKTGEGQTADVNGNKILDASDKAVPNGVASLDSDGKVPAEQLPASIGGGKSLGEIFLSQSKNASDNPGGLPLWTGEYYSNASSLYPDFYTWVKKHTELCKTKVEYDSLISTYGECPYYVIDEIAGSLRLPKLANYIKMANSTDGITQKSAGLPEHDHIMHGKGAIGGIIYLSNNAANYGRSGGETVGKSGTPATTMRTGDASESNSIYGNSTTVTPAHTTLYPWVYAFNPAVEASVAQAAEFNQSLTQKANLDLSNVPQNIDYVVDSYSDANGNWYRVYKSGWVEQGGVLTGTGEINITFLKPFNSTKYNIIKNYASNSDQSAQGRVVSVYNLTTTGAKTYNGVTREGISWYACGQGA